MNDTEKRIKSKKKNKTPGQAEGSKVAVIPYVEGLSEAVARVYRRYGISTAMRPHTTIQSLVVHPKDRLEKKEIGECVYRIPCKTCSKVYIGETGHSFGTRMNEHHKEVEHQEGRRFTRRAKAAAEEELNKSAIADHVNNENHVIDWDAAKILGRESDRTARWIREAIKIRKEREVMNRDEGAYHLRHGYDSLLSAATPSGEQVVRQRWQMSLKRH